MRKREEGSREGGRVNAQTEYAGAQIDRPCVYVCVRARSRVRVCAGGRTAPTCTGPFVPREKGSEGKGGCPPETMHEGDCGPVRVRESADTSVS